MSMAIIPKICIHEFAQEYRRGVSDIWQHEYLSLPVLFLLKELEISMS